MRNGGRLELRAATLRELYPPQGDCTTHLLQHNEAVASLHRVA